MTLTKLAGAALAAAMLVATLPSTGSAALLHSAEDRVVTNPNDGTEIAITVFTPSGAGPANPVPVILHSHGWAGSRETEVAGVEPYLDAGFGVVSIDQRGHGDSGGQANVQDPSMETEDISAVIDEIARWNWVAHDRDSDGNPIADDPVLGAIGGSYGGGYQTMTSLDEIAEEGRTRLDALAPQITWFDLPESLAPQGVVRSAWNVALYAAGASMVPQYIHEAFVWGSATGLWPDGTVLGEEVDGAPNLDAEFHKHSPVAFVEEGVRIDIPVLLRQGSSDNLFNLNQGLDIFNRALTEGAREQSYFVAFNGGHALPNAVPPGSPMAAELGGGEDACSGDFTQLTIRFFKAVFSGGDTSGVLPARYNLTDLSGERCIRAGSLRSDGSVPVEGLAGGNVVTNTGHGAPQQIAVAEGPLTVTGVPRLSGKVTSAGIEGRAFFGLAVGTTPADATVVQNNLMPLRRVLPVQDDEFSIELPGVAVTVPEGQTLFLTVTPFSDMYFGHGSRVPGALILSDLELTLPSPHAGKGSGGPGNNGKGKGKGHDKGHGKGHGGSNGKGHDEGEG